MRALSPEELTDPLSRPYTDCWTVVTSLCGLPALSVPMGLSSADSMPTGLMLFGPAGAEGDLLDVADAAHRRGADHLTIWKPCP